jgi:hypothetical protein
VYINRTLEHRNKQARGIVCLAKKLKGPMGIALCALEQRPAKAINVTVGLIGIAKPGTASLPKTAVVSPIFLGTASYSHI